jgi:uncharacterized membrane protein YhaH (DUF805 family)
MLSFYFSPYGRISPKDFWLKYVLVYLGLGIAAVLADMFLFPGAIVVQPDTGPAEAVVNVVMFWPQIALTTKRFHDRGMSGWWQVAFNIVLAAGGVFAYSAALQVDSDLGSVDPSLWMPLLVGGGIALAAALVELVILGFLPGTSGRNKYGDDPLNPTTNVAEVFS